MKKSKQSMGSRIIFSFCIFSIVVLSCATDQSPNKLPIIGHRDIVDGDTIYPTIRPFEFINQANERVNNATFKNQVTIADFFFTSCPTICPKVAQQMLRVYDKYESDERVALISFTVDPKRDTPEKLKSYAAKLEVELPKWQFLTGDKDSLHDISADYMSIALENPDAPGGFDHSGRLILVDQAGHVRAFCDGTAPDEVSRFLKEIDLLLNEA